MTREEAPASTRVLTVPNAISIARLCLVPLFLWAFLTGRTVPALVLLAVIGGSDWVDGFVARRTGQVSVLGKLIDPVADRIAIVAVLVAFGARGTVPPLLAGAIVLRDLAVAAAFAVLEPRGMPRIPVNRTGKTATAAIFTGMALAALALVVGEGPAPLVRAAGTGLLGAGAVLYWAAGALYAGEVRRWLRARGSAG